jgi:hypothetical protein
MDLEENDFIGDEPENVENINRKGKTKSVVWNFFKIENEGKKATCNQCNKELLAVSCDILRILKT